MPTPLPQPPSEIELPPLEESMKALEAFPSEFSGSEIPRSATTASSGRPRVSIAALLADGVECNWDEAVAIGQALCRTFMTARVLRRIVHDPDATNVSAPVASDTVFIDATGRVSMTANDPGDVPAAIQSIGKILSDILPAGNTLFFRTKIVSKALASPPQFGTIDELAEALAAFEHPNRRELIQALYERWAKRTGTLTPTVNPIAPHTTPPASTPDPAPVRSGYHPVVVAGVVIVAAIAIIGICGWLLFIRPHAGRGPIEAETAPPPQQEQVAPVASAKAPEPTPSSADTKNAGVHSPPPAAAPSRVAVSAPARSVARAQPPVVAPRPRVDRRTAQRLSATAPPAATRAQAAAPSVSRTDDAVARSNNGIGSGSATPRSSSKPPARSSPSSGLRPEPTASPMTYGAGDTDVTPPTPIFPQLLTLLRPSSPGVRLDALNIAVVVNEEGTVDSVRAVTAPQNMGEYVLLTSALSVVKSWHFHPATKDGAAVKYRQIVPLRMLTSPEP